MQSNTPITALLRLLLLSMTTPVLACKCWYTVGVPNYKFASKEITELCCNSIKGGHYDATYGDCVSHSIHNHLSKFQTCT
jgi:hypothetical protein